MHNTCQSRGVSVTSTPVTGLRGPSVLAYGFFNLSTVQFSVTTKPLFESFKGVVSTSSLDELHRTALSWLDAALLPAHPQAK